MRRIERIKRVRIFRLKKNKASPDMKGRVLGKSTNKYETWVADSGTSVSIIPINIANKRNGISWRTLDPDEPNYSGITGNQLSILGQTNIMVKFSTIKKAQEISALVCKEEASLISIPSRTWGSSTANFLSPWTPP